MHLSLRQRRGDGTTKQNLKTLVNGASSLHVKKAIVVRPVNLKLLRLMKNFSLPVYPSQFQ
jgi:hypothetical protein